MEMNPKTDLAKRVFEYLIDNPMTLLKFAEIVGVSHTAILRLMKGGTLTKPLNVFKIEKFLKEAESRKKRIN
jgi:hypothetical protein